MTALIQVLAGLGMFFFGLDELNDNLKQIVGQRFRLLLARWNRNRWLGALWGILAGAVMPSGPVVTFILVSLVRSGAITLPATLPILIGSNIGNSVIVLIAAIDLELWILLLLGLTGVLRLSDRLRAARPLLSALFGLALLYFGLSLIKSGASGLADTAGAEALLATIGTRFLAVLAVGMLLRYLSQSSSAVSLLAVALTGAGVFSIEQAVMLVYGSNLGSSISILTLAAGLRGRELQLAYYQAFYNVLGGLILVPLFYLEVQGGVPLVIALLARLSASVEQQVALAFLIFNLVPGLVLLPLIKQAAALLDRLSPPTAVEQDARPAYLYDHAQDEAETGLDLVGLEQARLMGFLPRYLTIARAPAEAPGRDALHRQDAACEALGAAIDEFLSGLGRTALSGQSYERLSTAIGAQALIRSLRASLSELTVVIRGIGARSSLRGLADNMIEGLEATLLLLNEAVASGDHRDLAFLRVMTGERHDVLQQIRATYTSASPPLTARESVDLLTMTSLYERLLWLLARYLTVREREILARHPEGATAAQDAA